MTTKPHCRLLLAVALAIVIQAPLVVSAKAQTVAVDRALLEQLQQVIAQQQEQLKQQTDQLDAQMETIQALKSRVDQLEQRSTEAETIAAKAQSTAEKAMDTAQNSASKGASDPVVTSGSEKVRLAISGQINRGVLFADDGDSSDIFHVDNDNSSTRFRFTGEADVGSWTAGTVLEAEFESNSTGDVNQNSQSTSASLKERKIEFFIEQPSYGKLTVGQGDTASNNTAEVDLSGTSVVGYSAITDMAGGLLFFDKNTNALSSTRIKNVASNFDGLSRDDRLRYDTPKFYGVSLAASHVADDQWDLAIFQSGRFGDFDLAGAAGYADPNNNRDYRLSASYSVRHASGLNLTVAGGQDELETGDRDPWSAYAKLGYIIDWKRYDAPAMARIGKTNLAVDYHRTEDLAQNGDEFKSIGGFIVQNVDDWAADLYVGVRWHDLDRNDANFDDIFASMVGGRFKF